VLEPLTRLHVAWEPLLSRHYAQSVRQPLEVYAATQSNSCRGGRCQTEANCRLQTGGAPRSARHRTREPDAAPPEVSSSPRLTIGNASSSRVLRFCVRLGAAMLHARQCRDEDCRDTLQFAKLSLREQLLYLRAQNAEMERLTASERRSANPWEIKAFDIHKELDRLLSAEAGRTPAFAQYNQHQVTCSVVTSDLNARRLCMPLMGQAPSRRFDPAGNLPSLRSSHSMPRPEVV